MKKNENIKLKTENSNSGGKKIKNPLYMLYQLHTLIAHQTNTMGKTKDVTPHRKNPNYAKSPLIHQQKRKIRAWHNQQTSY